MEFDSPLYVSGSSTARCWCPIFIIHSAGALATLPEGQMMFLLFFASPLSGNQRWWCCCCCNLTERRAIDIQANNKPVNVSHIFASRFLLLPLSSSSMLAEWWAGGGRSRIKLLPRCCCCCSTEARGGTGMMLAQLDDGDNSSFCRRSMFYGNYSFSHP